jgi:serine/threonine protein kinase
LSEYTQIWLEEYSRHFELSNYVPLPPGCGCGDGRFIIRLLVAARINSSTYLAATDKKANVIIKELVAPIDSGDTMQKKLLEQFNREAAILASLDHPGIVRVVDHFIEDGRSYIVMEQASGQNMREFVRLRGFLPEQEVLPIAEQLVSVLQYLHQHSPGILHRDFTPDNLIYASNGTIKVVDFGAANVYNTGKTATLIGKQGYMPPEQLRGKPSPASDIYAFGATLSFLLSGTDMSSMGKTPAVLASHTGPQLLALIEKCTSLDEQARPDCDEILATLQSLTQLAPLQQS